jgi:hypothetical protein
MQARPVLCASRTFRRATVGDRFDAADRCPQRTERVAILVAEPPLEVIVTFTVNSLPFAVFGTTNETRATPFLNCCPCVITFPATEGMAIIVPSVSGLLLSLRITRKLTVARFPAVGLGQTTAGEITGRTGATGGGGDGVVAANVNMLSAGFGSAAR